MSKVERKKRLAAVAVLAACAASGGAAAQVPVQAQGQAAGQAGVAEYKIGPGSLADALVTFRQDSGLSVVFDVPAGQADDFRTRGVRGQLTNAEALRQLLDGTGLTATFQSATEVTVGLRHADTVEVTSTLPDGVAMTKFTQPLVDTPETIAVVPKFVLDDEGVTTLRDALRNVPGVSLAAGEAGAQGDNLTIRGFTARNDIFLDGIRDFGSYYRDDFNYDQVEVLEGPAGVAFGRGSTGGVVNQESKVPQATPHVEVQAQFGTNLERRVVADINEPLPELPVIGAAGGAALRVSLMGTESGVAGRPGAELRRYGVAPSLTLGLNSRTRFTLGYFHLTENDTPDYGLPWFYSQLAPGVSRNAYFGFQDENLLRTNDDVLTARLEHTFNDHVVLYSIARAANYPRNAQITEPQICTNPTLPVPVGGYVSALPTSSVTGAVCPYVFGAVDPATILVNRNQIQIKSVEGDLWDQTELGLRFKIFGLRHEFTGGIEGGQEISNPIRYGYTINKLNTVPSTTLINPNTAQVFGGTGYVTTVTHAKVETVGAYFVDTVHLGRKVDLTGGIRFDRADSGYNQYAPTPPTGGTVQATCPVGTTGTQGSAATCSTSVGAFSRVDEQPTYRAAIVYRTNAKGSVYFDYGTSFNPSAESLGLTSITQNVAPEENETYEVGAKQGLLNDRLMVEGAVFRTEKDNARETNPSDSTSIVVAGNQVVKGMQVSAVGRLPHGMDLVAGYAYLSSAVVYSPFYPASVGYQLANVPRQTFNAFLTHSLPMRFEGGFGGNYVASRTASSTTPFVPTNFGPAQKFAVGTSPCGATATTCYPVTATAMKQVPGYWVFNAMLRRPLTDRIDFQANVNNLLNRFYIDQPHPSHLIPGEALNALMGFNFKF